MKVTAADVVELDRLIDGMQRLRARLVTESALANAETGGTDENSEADLLAHNLLDTQSASTRFNLPQDRVRRWCREGCGARNGGRWLASIPRFQRRLRGG